MMHRMRDLVQHNLAAKIAAVVIAFLLWGYVMNDQNPVIESTYTVPLTVLNAPSGYQLTNETKEIKLKVKAARSLFVSTSVEDFHAFIDLSGLTEGTQEVKVQTSLPQGFELVEARPDAVEVTLDKLVSKTFKVDYMTTGSAAAGAAVASFEPSVTYLSVSGPDSLLSTVSRVVGYISLNGQKEDFTQEVSLVALGSDGREIHGLTLSKESSSVKVQLARGLTRKVVSVHPVVGTELGADYTLGSVQAKPANIEIAGPEDLLKSISSVDTATISLSGVTANTTKTVTLALPEGVTVSNPNVTVSITVKPKEKTVEKQGE